METGYLSTLRFPKKSHRKQISIPLESPKLAELIGIVFGDGGINNSWQLVITLNSKADLEYSLYVRELIEGLFGIEVAVRKRPGQNALVLVCSSSNLVDFLVLKGAVRGNKISQGISMPAWIDESEDFKKAFVKGLVDTDGCLYIHDHVVDKKRYKNLGFCFTSYSEPLLDSVKKILESQGIFPYLSCSTKLYLYSVKQVSKYLDVFGTSNPRIRGKYREWTNLRNVATISA